MQMRIGFVRTYFDSRRHLLDLFIKHFLHAFTHRRHCMIWPIECNTITKNQPYVRDELVGVEITGILRVGIRLGRIGGGEFPLDSREIHGILDDRRIMGYVESNGIHRS